MSVHLLPTLKRVARAAITVLIIGYVAYVSAGILDANTERLHTIGVLPALALAFGYATWLVVFEGTWTAVLSALLPNGHGIDAVERGRIFYKSLLARYIPGKVAFVAVRTEALTAHGIPRGTTITAVLVEQACFQAATVILFIATSPLFIGMLGADRASPTVIALGLGVAALSTTFFIAPRAVLGLMARLPRRRIPTKLRELMSALTSIPAGTWRSINGRFLLLAVGQGLLILAVAWPFLGGGDWEAWVIVTAAYPVARLAGQLGLAVPAGLGVREGVYILFTAPVLDQLDALAIAGYMRLFSIVLEVTLYFAYSLAQRRAAVRRNTLEK